MALVTNHYFSRKLVIAFSTSKYHERSYIFISIDSSRRDQSIDIQIIGWRRRRHLLQFYRLLSSIINNFGLWFWFYLDFRSYMTVFISTGSCKQCGFCVVKNNKIPSAISFSAVRFQWNRTRLTHWPRFSSFRQFGFHSSAAGPPNTASS